MTTHTFALLEVSPSTYSEVRDLLEKAGYEHAFLEDGAIDMHGIALVERPCAHCAARPPGAAPICGNHGDAMVQRPEPPSWPEGKSSGKTEALLEQLPATASSPTHE